MLYYFFIANTHELRVPTMQGASPGAHVHPVSHFHTQYYVVAGRFAGRLGSLSI